MIKKLLPFLVIIYSIFSVFANDYEFYYNQSRQLLNQGKKLESVESIKQALLLNPDSKRALQLYIQLLTEDVSLPETDITEEIISDTGETPEKKIVDSKDTLDIEKDTLDVEKDTLYVEKDTLYVEKEEDTPKSQVKLSDFKQVFLNQNYRKHDHTINGIYKLEFIPYSNKSEIIITAASKFDYLPSRISNPPMIIIDIPNSLNFLPFGRYDISFENIDSIRHSQFRMFPVPTTRIVVDVKDWNLNYNVDYLNDNSIVLTITYDKSDIIFEEKDLTKITDAPTTITDIDRPTEIADDPTIVTDIDRPTEITDAPTTDTDIDRPTEITDAPTTDTDIDRPTEITDAPTIVTDIDRPTEITDAPPSQKIDDTVKVHTHEKQVDSDALTIEQIKRKDPPPSKLLHVLTDKRIELTAGDDLVMPIFAQALYNNKPLPITPVEVVFNNEKTILATDDDGILEISDLTIPLKSGRYTLKLTLLESQWSEYIDFVIHPTMPANILKISGDYQRIHLSSLISNPLVVRVTDKYDNPVSNVNVYFSILTGSGELRNSIVQTDMQGFAKCTYYRTGLSRGFNIINASIIVDDATYYETKNLIMTASTDLTNAMKNLMDYIETPSSDINLLIFEAHRNLNFQRLKNDVFTELTSSGKIKDFPQYNTLFISDESNNLKNIMNIIENYKGVKISSKTLRSVNFTVESIPRLLSIDFINANLSDVIRTLAELGDWNISYPDLSAAQPVNVHLKDVPALFALDTILENQGLTRIRQGNIIKIVYKDEARFKGMETTTGINFDHLPDGNHFITHVVHLNYANGEVISNALDPLRSNDGVITFEESSNSLIITETVSNIRRFLKIINEFDKVAKESALGEKPYLEIYTLNYEDPSVIKSKLDILINEIRSGQSFTERQDARQTDRRRPTQQTDVSDVRFSTIEQFALIPHDEKSVLIVYATPDNHQNIKSILNVVDRPIESSIKVFSANDLNGNCPDLISSIIYEMRTLKENQNQQGKFIPYGGIYEINEVFHQPSREMRTVREEIEADPRRYNLIVSDDKLGVIAEIDVMRNLTRFITDIVQADIDLEKLRANINIVSIYEMNYIEPGDFINYLRNVENISFPYAHSISSDEVKSLILIAEESIHSHVRRILNTVDIPELKNINLFTNVRVFDRVTDLSNNNPENLRDIILTMPSLNANRDNSGRYIEPNARQRVYDSDKNFIREELIDPREYQIIASNEQLILLAPPEPLREISKIVSDIIISRIDIDELRVPLREFENIKLNYITGIQAINYLTNIENKVFDYITDASDDDNYSITIIGSREDLIDVHRIIKKIDTPGFSELNFQDKLFRETVKLNYISVNNILSLLDRDKSIGSLLSADGKIFVNESDNSLVVNDRKINVDRVKSAVKNYDIPLSIQTEIIPLKNLEAVSLRNMLGRSDLLGKHLTDNGNIVISSVRNALIVNDHPFVIQTIKSILNELDTYDYEKDNWIITKTFYLKHARASSQFRVAGEFSSLVSEGIESRLKDLLEENITVANEMGGKLFGIVTTDERTNSITVISTKKDMRVIEQIIDALDIAPKQVLIEAKIVERTITTGDAFGINWAYGFNKGVNTSIGADASTRTSGSGFEFSPGSVDGSFTGTLSSGQFRVMLEALERSQSADVLSRPNVFTMNNIPAEISVIQKVPYTTSLRDADGFVSTTQEVVDVPIELKILPQIGSDRTIQLNINIDVSKADPAPAGNRPPVSQRNLNTRVFVADGQTVILGGIFIDNRQIDESALPGTRNIRKIPIIGGLFGRKSVDRFHTELLLFVTPRIVDSPIEAEQLKHDFVQNFGEISEKDFNLNISSMSDIIDYYLVMILPELQDRFLQRLKTKSGFSMQRSLPRWLRDDAFAYSLAKALKDYKVNNNVTFISLDDINNIVIEYNYERRPISFFEGLTEALISKSKFMVNINTVTAEELSNLPVIDLKLARHIVNVRTRYRYFSSLEPVEEILLRAGIRQNFYDNYLKRIFTVGLETTPKIYEHDLVLDDVEPIHKVDEERLSFNLNRVSKNELEKIDILTDIEIDLIIAYRRRHDGFASVNELLNIPLVNAKFNEIKNYFFILD